MSIIPLKKILKAENLSVLISLLAFLSKFVLPKVAKDFLLYHKLNEFFVFGLLSIQIFTCLTTILYFKGKSIRKEFLKKINGVLSKLNSPVVFESYSPFNKQIMEKRVFNSEILKSFDEYNQIIIDMKNKWPDKFFDLTPLTNTINIAAGDWIPESELNGVKISFLQLKERI
jgi:hypothetical protein